MQALKATTESAGPGIGIGPAASRTGGANALEDDDLKPSFMRRAAPDRSPPSHGKPLPMAVSMHADTHPKAPSTANEAISQDPNPSPVMRRRTDSTKTAARAKAKAVMQVGPCHLLPAHVHKQTRCTVGLACLLLRCLHAWLVCSFVKVLTSALLVSGTVDSSSCVRSFPRFACCAHQFSS